MNDNIHKTSIWHEEAMDFAEMAFFAKRRNEQYGYWKYIQRALNYEKAAARLLKDLDTEPSRSILYQGAIHFALNLDNFNEARKLLSEALEGSPPVEIRKDLEEVLSQLDRRERIRKRVSAIAQGFLEEEEELQPADVKRAIDAAVSGAENFFGKETLDVMLNRMALQAFLESKNLVSNPDYQIFENPQQDTAWIKDRKNKIQWNFWNAYKKYLDDKGMAAPTVKKLDHLTNEILDRIGDPEKSGIWNKRGMVVGDVQSGKTSNYIGLINKAADVGFRIIIILTGLYENLRQQTQQRVDEGFIGRSSDPLNSQKIGVGLSRIDIPIHPLTHSENKGDLSRLNLKNHPIRTNDYYILVIKKNPAVLKSLLNWLYNQGENDGDYRIIRKAPLLMIDDEADYASINVDKEFVSQINGYIRSVLGLFEQSSFIGYTATPFANVFISDFNQTEGKDNLIDQRRFRLGKDLFPKDFIINIPPPSNYIGYTKIFNTSLDDASSEDIPPMVNVIDDFELYIPQKHLKNDPLPKELPPSLKYAIHSFIIACAIRIARGQEKEHNSMLVHVSWYIDWINHIAGLIDEYLQPIKNKIRYDRDEEFVCILKQIWELEFKGRTDRISSKLGYEDPRLIEHDWDEIAPFLGEAVEKIEVRAVHGPQKGTTYQNIHPLNYDKYQNGLSVIAVGGNKLSRGLTLEGLSISYFLRATKFYDTLLQMGRWFGYRIGYADICRVFTTQELVTWYQYIGNATEELKEQFDIMDLSERNPGNFGLKVRSAPGMLMISAAAKIKGATDLNLSYSGELLETYRLSKSRDIIRNNLSAVKDLVDALGSFSGKVRQRQRYIWENVSYNLVDSFLESYMTKQYNIRQDFVRGYISRQLKKQYLANWTVVLISNSADNDPYNLQTNNYTIKVGKTFRKEVEYEKNGVKHTDSENYIIRNSHIISPPHEFLDIDETDQRYIEAKDETIVKSKSSTEPKNPAGKYIRKHRGPQNALLLIYLLDPSGFSGDIDLPAVGYAISLPEIENDDKLPYKVNNVYLEELFNYPDDAEEDPENENEN